MLFAGYFCKISELLHPGNLLMAPGLVAQARPVCSKDDEDDPQTFRRLLLPEEYLSNY